MYSKSKSCEFNSSCKGKLICSIIKQTDTNGIMQGMKFKANEGIEGRLLFLNYYKSSMMSYNMYNDSYLYVKCFDVHDVHV